MTIGAQLQRALSLGVLFTVSACGAADGGTQNEASGGSTTSGGASGGNAAGGTGGGVQLAPLCDSMQLKRVVEFRLEPPSGVALPQGGAGAQVDQSGTLTEITLSSEPCTTNCEFSPHPRSRS